MSSISLVGSNSFASSHICCTQGNECRFANLVLGIFDAVSSAWLVRNLADLPAGFREMRRVTRPGGRVVCVEMSHPYNPVFNLGYHLYIDRLVPLLGRLIGKSSEAYSYLPSSVVAHPDAPTLLRIMREAGWNDVRYYYLLGGVVAVHVATNPGGERAG